MSRRHPKHLIKESGAAQSSELPVIASRSKNHEIDLRLTHDTLSDSDDSVSCVRLRSRIIANNLIFGPRRANLSGRGLANIL